MGRMIRPDSSRRKDTILGDDQQRVARRISRTRTGPRHLHCDLVLSVLQNNLWRKSDWLVRIRDVKNYGWLAGKAAYCNFITGSAAESQFVGIRLIRVRIHNPDVVHEA